MSYINLSSIFFAFSRWYFIALVIIIIFLPIIPLLNRAHPRRYDVTATLTSSTPCPAVDCVLTATSPAHTGRLIALKKMSGGRLGNDMFVYASLLGIAARNKMIPIYHCDALEHVFNVTGTGSYVIKPPATNIAEESPFRSIPGS